MGSAPTICGVATSGSIDVVAPLAPSEAIGNPGEMTSLPPFTRHLHGLAVIVGPVLLLASTIAFIADGDGINDGVLGGTFSVWACFALGFGLVGVLRVLEPRAPRAAPLLTLMVIAGVAGGTAFSVDAIYNPFFGIDGDRLFESPGGDAIAIFAFLPWGWMIPLTLVIAGILLWRTETTAPAIGALMIASGILFVAGRPARIEPLVLLSDVVMIAALVPLGRAMLLGGASEPRRPAARSESPA
jgi:hypothetical protein